MNSINVNSELKKIKEIDFSNDNFEALNESSVCLTYLHKSERKETEYLALIHKLETYINELENK